MQGWPLNATFCTRMFIQHQGRSGAAGWLITRPNIEVLSAKLLAESPAWELDPNLKAWRQVTDGAGTPLERQPERMRQLLRYALGIDWDNDGTRTYDRWMQREPRLFTWSFCWDQWIERSEVRHCFWCGHCHQSALPQEYCNVQRATRADPTVYDPLVSDGSTARSSVVTAPPADRGEPSQGPALDHDCSATASTTVQGSFSGQPGRARSEHIVAASMEQEGTNVGDGGSKRKHSEDQGSDIVSEVSWPLWHRAPYPAARCLLLTQRSSYARYRPWRLVRLAAIARMDAPLACAPVGVGALPASLLAAAFTMHAGCRISCAVPAFSTASFPSTSA